MITQFEEFREAYLQYIDEYNSYKVTQFVSINGSPVDTSDHIRSLSNLQIALGQKTTRLLYQLWDTFPDVKQKKAYLQSVKNFVSTELANWREREPQTFSYPWTNRVQREWMPWGLYDILDEVEKVENEMPPESEKKKPTNIAKKPDYSKISLPDVWQLNRTHYNKVIEYLSESNPTLGTPFITASDVSAGAKEKWIANNQYLGAFVRTCLIAGFIPKLKAKEYLLVICNTFDIPTKGEDIFKPGTNFDDVPYMDAFKNLKSIPQ